MVLTNGDLARARIEAKKESSVSSEKRVQCMKQKKGLGTKDARMNIQTSVRVFLFHISIFAHVPFLLGKSAHGISIGIRSRQFAEMYYFS